MNEKKPGDAPAQDPSASGALREDGPGASSSWSSKPEVDGTAPVTVPGLGLRGTLLFLWRQLTSMQTALILLMLLAIGVAVAVIAPFARGARR